MRVSLCCAVLVICAVLPLRAQAAGDLTAPDTCSRGLDSLAMKASEPVPLKIIGHPVGKAASVGGAANGQRLKAHPGLLQLTGNLPSAGFVGGQYDTLQLILYTLDTRPPRAEHRVVFQLDSGTLDRPLTGVPGAYTDQHGTLATYVVRIPVATAVQVMRQARIQGSVDEQAFVVSDQDRPELRSLLLYAICGARR